MVLKQVLSIKVSVDLGAIAMKRYFTLPDPQKWSLTMQYNVVARTFLFRGGLTPFKGYSKRIQFPTEWVIWQTGVTQCWAFFGTNIFFLNFILIFELRAFFSNFGGLKATLVAWFIYSFIGSGIKKKHFNFWQRFIPKLISYIHI